VAIYTASTKMLGAVDTPLVQLDIARRAVAKVSRTLFVAHELCSQVGCWGSSRLALPDPGPARSRARSTG
jgi:hypothetical protein